MIDRDNLAYILSMPRGRKLIWELLGLSGFMQNPFDPSSERLSDFACGNKQTAIALFAECMETSPDLTAMMLKEQGNVDKQRAAELQSNGGIEPDAKLTDAERAVSAERRRLLDELDPNGLGFDRSGLGLTNLGDV